MQVVLLELLLRHFSYIAIGEITWVIQQVHLDIAEELIVFGEHYDDGNFKIMS